MNLGAIQPYFHRSDRSRYEEHGLEQIHITWVYTRMQ